MTSTPWTDRPHSAYPERSTPVLDRKLSQQLDLLIIQLDERPPALRRAWLRARKAWLEELYVPRNGGGR